MKRIAPPDALSAHRTHLVDDLIDDAGREPKARSLEYERDLTAIRLPRIARKDPLRN